MLFGFGHGNKFSPSFLAPPDRKELLGDHAFAVSAVWLQGLALRYLATSLRGDRELAGLRACCRLSAVFGLKPSRGGVGPEF